MFSSLLEGLASEVLRASGFDSDPVDAVELAQCCGLEVCFADIAAAALYDNTVYVSRRARLVRAHWLIAHEVGHWVLARAGEPDSEADADYVGRALLVPRRAIGAGWDLNALRAHHPNAPASVIAARVAGLRGATAAVYDGTRLRRRFGPRLSCEGHLLDAALVSGLPSRRDGTTGAWPVFDGSFRRVVVLGTDGEP